MNELLIERKTEHLLNVEVYPLLKNFPKSEKYSLCQEIKQAFYGLLRSIMLANSIKHKRRPYQEEADSYQKLLLILINTAYQQRYITEKKKLQLQARLEEIGRLLGGWMKSTK
ncbi:MAG: four helix bundle protein [Firmicutes bacterium]|nr:four helix bundle protein [Bacillota bacterium]